MINRERTLEHPSLSSIFAKYCSSRSNETVQMQVCLVQTTSLLNPIMIKPSHLIIAVQEMQEELEKLEKEATALLEKQDTVKQQLGKTLEVACKELQNLQSNVGSGLTGYKTIHTDVSGSALKKHFDKMNV